MTSTLTNEFLLQKARSVVRSLATVELFFNICRSCVSIAIWDSIEILRSETSRSS